MITAVDRLRSALRGALYLNAGGHAMEAHA